MASPTGTSDRQGFVFLAPRPPSAFPEPESSLPPWVWFAQPEPSLPGQQVWVDSRSVGVARLSARAKADPGPSRRRGSGPAPHPLRADSPPEVSLPGALHPVLACLRGPVAAAGQTGCGDKRREGSASHTWFLPGDAVTARRLRGTVLHPWEGSCGVWGREDPSGLR